MDPTQLHPRLAGASFRPEEARDLVRALNIGDEVAFEREPDNQYDPNAIKVLKDGTHIGYIQRDLAELIAPEMDAGTEFYGTVDAKIKPLEPLFRVHRVGDDEEDA